MLLYPRYNAPAGALRHSVALAVQPLSSSQQLAPGDGLPHRHRCKAALDLNGEYFPVRTGRTGPCRGGGSRTVWVWEGVLSMARQPPVKFRLTQPNTSLRRKACACAVCSSRLCQEHALHECLQSAKAGAWRAADPGSIAPKSMHQTRPPSARTSSKNARPPRPARGALQQALRVLSGPRRAVTASVQPPSRAILSNRRRSVPPAVAA